MAINRVTYRRQVNPISFPNVEFSQYPAQAEMFKEINQRIDTIKNFAIEAGTEEAIEKGRALGLTNPINIADFLNADPVTREKFLSTGNTALDKAFDATRINILTTDIETNSLTQLNDLTRTANSLIGTDAEATPESFAALMYGVIDGSVEALQGDPEAAISLYSSLTTKANALYKSYLDNVEEAHIAELKATALAGAYEIKTMIPDFIGQDGLSADEQEILTWESQIEFLMEQAENKMRVVGTPEEDIIKWNAGVMSDINTIVKDKYFRTYVQNPALFDPNKTDLQNAGDITRQIEAAFAGEGDHPKLLSNDNMAERYFNLMGPQKSELLKDARAWYNGVVKRFNDTESDLDTQAEINGNAVIASIATELRQDTPDFTKIDNYITQLQEYTKKDSRRYATFYQDAINMTSDFEEAFIDDGITENDVRDGIITGDYGYGDLSEFANKGTVGSKRYPEFYDLITTTRKENYNYAANILRQFSDIPTLRTDGTIAPPSDTYLGKSSDEQKQARALDAILQRELFTWSNANPDATRAELTTKAYEIIESSSVLQAHQQQLKDLSSKINRKLEGSKATLRNIINNNNVFPEGVRFMSYYDFAQKNPELFDSVVIGTLRRIYDGQITKPGTMGDKTVKLTGYSQDELLELILQMEEYISNPLFEERIND